jgi:hypothetical protein
VNYSCDVHGRQHAVFVSHIGAYYFIVMVVDYEGLIFVRALFEIPNS